MSPIAVIAVVLAGIGSISILVVLVELWTVGSREQMPVGPWEPRTPAEAAPPRLPSDYLSLWSAEAANWSRSEHEWRRLVERLDTMEVALGGTSRRGPAPLQYSSDWLHKRLFELEQLAGPMPGLEATGPGSAKIEKRKR